MTIEVKDVYLDNELENYKDEPEFEVYEFDDSMLDPKVIERGIKDIEEGREFTLEEVEQHMIEAAKRGREYAKKSKE